MSDPLLLSSIPPEHIPPGMKTVLIGVPFLPAVMEALSELKSKKVFVLANQSSLRFLTNEGGGRGHGHGHGHEEGDDDDEEEYEQQPSESPSSFVEALRDAGMLAAPICTSVGMGGDEIGLLRACDAARDANADVVVTIGGGAVQDAGKLVRLWLSGRGEAREREEEEEDECNDDEGDDDGREASVSAILALAGRDPMPPLPPQIALPNSFAMAEATSVAGITTSSKVKSGASHPSLIPTVVVYDPELGRGLPDWVRLGTALRGVEHAVGAITHPKADEDVRTRAAMGLATISDGLRRLVTAAYREDPEAMRSVYVGGFVAIRALNTRGCYPSIGHLVENHYSARFGVHQGGCSGMLCARILDYHYENSVDRQMLISAALSGGGIGGGRDDGVAAATTTTAAAATPAPRLVRDLVATLPGVYSEHAQAGVTESMLREFAHWMFENHIGRLDALCPRSFRNADDIYGMLTKPLSDL